MAPDNLFAFYGSLRKGMENYEIYRNRLQYLYSARIKGFKLFSRGPYPHAVKTGGHSSIVVEIFRIDDPVTRNSIDQLELEAGYYVDYVLIGEVNVKIYLFEPGGNYQEVEGGDWVTFFRERPDQ